MYTLRKASDGSVSFILDSGTTSEDYSPLGSPYEEMDKETLMVFNPTTSARVLSDFYTDQWGTWLSARAPILDGEGSVEAVLGMDISADEIKTRQLNILILVVLIALITAIVGVLVGIVVSRRISRPLLAIARDMEQIQRFELSSVPLLPSSIAEVKIMETALENMKKGLRSFKKYVPADVVSQLITLQKEAVLETSKETLTVFFSDLENFTGASELVGAERIAEILGHYFEAMTSTLQSHHATVDKFIGDAVMAFWNAPQAQADHAIRACLAALDCSRAVHALAPTWQASGITGLRTRIGIHTGVAVVGNIGYTERLSYTALGDTVNLASRLESLNKHYGTNILISEETYQLVHQVIKGRLIDKVAVKGRSKGGGIYQIFDNPPPWLDRWDSAIQSYLSGAFAKAHQEFTALSQDLPNDGPTLILLERCSTNLKHPPKDWTGITVMHDK